MLVWKTVEKLFSFAVIGFALSGVAAGQVAGPGLGNGSVDPDVQIDKDVAARATVPPVNSAALPGSSTASGINTVRGIQSETVRPGVDASTSAEGQNSNTDVRSTTNVRVDGRQNLPNGSADVSPFGATFDSAITDRIVIRDLQPNSTASRLGLQAGDRIIGFNGQTYTDANQFNRDLARLDKNADVPMIYERNGQRFTQRLRMPAINAQQSGNDGSYGNQGWNGQPDQGLHSANRPVYGASSNSSYSGGMYQGQSCSGNTGMSGNGYHSSSACCGDSMQVAPVHSGHCEYRQRHGGRRHRNRCR